MNICIFVGNLTADPELKHTASGIPTCAFTLAVQRDYKNAKGEYEADFIRCVAWRQSAEFICRYLSKGDKLAVNGVMQNRTYDAQDGTKRYVTEIIVSKVQPCGGVRRNDGANQSGMTEETIEKAQAMFGADFTEVDDDELPF